jgi:short subunit dehydrogenase-like uncharacterized protein
MLLRVPTRKARSRPFDLALYGATGFTGRLTAEVLRGRGLKVVLAGRNRGPLEALAGGDFDVAVAAADDASALTQLAASAEVLLSCAGPFAEVGALPVAAAVAAGTHYLDSTGEADFMAQTFRRHARQAAAANVVVMNSCAFEYVLGDCAIAIGLESVPDAVSVDISYLMGDITASRGTVLSALSLLGGGFGKMPTRSRSEDFGDRGRHWTVSYPGGEPELWGRRRPDLPVTSWFSTPMLVARAAPLTSALGPVIRTGLVRGMLRRAVERMPAGPDEATRQRQGFLIKVTLHRRSGPPGEIFVQGTDPYGLTAELLAGTAERLLRGEMRAVGVVGPSEAFDPHEYMATLAGLGVVVTGA